MSRSNLTKNKYKDVFIGLGNYFVLFGLIIFSYLTYNSSSYYNIWAEFISILSILLLIYQIIILRMRQYRIISFQFVFTILSFVFLFGQIWLIGFGREEAIFWGVIFRYSDELLYRASLFSLCYSQAILIGFLFKSKMKIKKKSFLSKISKDKMSKYMYSAGVVLLIISIPFRLYMDIYSLLIVRMLGGYQGIATPVGPMKDIAILTIPSIILLLASQYKSKRTNTIIAVVTIFYLIFFMMITGDRRYYVTALISIVFVFIELYTPKLRFRTIIKYGIAGSLGLNFLSLLRQTRRYSISIGEFISAYFTELIAMNPIVETLSEFGLTFMTVVFAQKLVPNIIPYQLGFSFYGAIPSLLPIGWLVGDFFKDVSVARALNTAEGYPMGSSLPAELYANFGWFGILGAIFFGIVLSRIFLLNDSYNTPKEFLVARYYATFYILINFVRASTIEMFRQGIIVYFVPTFTIYLLWSLSKKST
ncbi:MAG: hypothetical protein CVV00_05145 [Firmicutes bacterium HGW-Firmicutes-5]|nr:MAG: hypothetical protein CVV00_05145 [Firmicutes bacterium HGW-Firmicutes-5]